MKQVLYTYKYTPSTNKIEKQKIEVNHVPEKHVFVTNLFEENILDTRLIPDDKLNLIFIDINKSGLYYYMCSKEVKEFETMLFNLFKEKLEMFKKDFIDKKD